ncbi:MAG TPA: zinc ribbon domain-containing protein [Thermoplasmata archaeon]|nr:zinc ribbon domain-containing protein [Thermoplasmata archaeon]
MTYAAPRRTTSGWLANSAAVLLIAAGLLTVGIILTLLAALSFFMSMINFGLSGGNFGILGSSLTTVIVVGGIGVALSSAGGFLLRFWWIFLLVDVARGSIGVDRSAPPVEVKVRCRSCGRMNQPDATYCITCGRAI